MGCHTHESTEVGFGRRLVDRSHPDLLKPSTGVVELVFYALESLRVTGHCKRVLVPGMIQRRSLDQ